MMANERGTHKKMGMVCFANCMGGLRHMGMGAWEHALLDYRAKHYGIHCPSNFIYIIFIMQIKFDGFLFNLFDRL